MRAMGFIKTVIQPEERECNLRQVRKTLKVDMDPNDAAKSTKQSKNNNVPRT